jgi:hypothetical protein
MILSSFKIYTNISKLEPATRNNLDRFGFGYRQHKIHVLKHEIYSNKDRKRGKADPNPSRLGKSVLHEFKHKVELKVTRGNLMNY